MRNSSFVLLVFGQDGGGVLIKLKKGLLRTMGYSLVQRQDNGEGRFEF